MPPPDDNVTVLQRGTRKGHTEKKKKKKKHAPNWKQLTNPNKITKKEKKRRTKGWDALSFSHLSKKLAKPTVIIQCTAVMQCFASKFIFR
jgi:hypothetical protein